MKATCEDGKYVTVQLVRRSWGISKGGQRGREERGKGRAIAYGIS
jgi:hypothetical protein